MSDEVTKRNIRALHQGLTENRERVNERIEEDKKLNNRITMLEGEVTRLKSMVHALLAQTKGGGPTGGN